MKRRGLFGFLATAPIAVVTGANAAAQNQKKPEPDCDKPLFKDCNIIMNGGFSFRHGTPVKGWSQNPLLSIAQVPAQTDIKNHGSMIMHDGELFIRSEHGDWRKIS